MGQSYQSPFLHMSHTTSETYCWATATASFGTSHTVVLSLPALLLRFPFVGVHMASCILGHFCAHADGSGGITNADCRRGYSHAGKP